MITHCYMLLAPIVLFTYNRPGHTRRTVESLLRNTLAFESDLIVYSDAARSTENVSLVDKVRTYLTTITGFRSIKVIHRPSNFGLSKSIIKGVTEVLHQFDRAIILEDDMVTSPYFLTYMNEALEQFSDNERIVSIHGYVYPTAHSLPEAFFLQGADCWGWGTWKRGWDCFNEDGQFLLDELKRRKLTYSFDFNDSHPYTKMLKKQSKGANDSWAIRWYASAFLAGKLTLYPGRSLVHNIGNDNSGTHCGKSTHLDAEVSQTPINLNGITVEHSLEGRKAIENYFRQQKKCWLKSLTSMASSYTNKLCR